MAVDNRVQNLLTDLSELRRQQREVVRAPLHRDGGGGTSGDMPDDWKVSVDRQLGQLHGDVRNLLYGLIGGFLILASGGWVAYEKLSSQITSAQIDQAKTLGAAETRDAVVTGKLDVLLVRLERSDGQADKKQAAKR